MRRFLALDQSLSSTGFALWDEGDPIPQTGAWQLCDGIASRALGFVELHQRINAIQSQRAIDFMGYEQPIKRPTDKVEKLIALYGLAAHVESYARIKLILCDAAPQNEWRKQFFGRSVRGEGTEAIKRLAVERCRQLGIDPATHDAAEAVGILEWMLLQNRIIPPWREARPFLPMI